MSNETGGKCPLRPLLGPIVVSGALLSAAYAYFFKASSANPKDTSLEHNLPLENRLYEQAQLLNQYLLLHYGEHVVGNYNKTTDQYGNENSLNTFDVQENYGDFSFFNVETGQKEAPQFPYYALNFPARVAELAAYFAPKGDNTCALDVGCAVGRGTFELTPYFNTVEGVDYSHNFIEAANQLKYGKSLPFTAVLEGNISCNTTAKIGTHVKAERAFFYQGDATALNTDKQYDCITAANLIDRLPSPRKFLETLPIITKPDGIVVLTSPYTWLEEFTPKEEWLVSEDCPSTFVALKKLMEPHFELVMQSHMPFLIRETARKNQFTFAHATVWKRRA